MVAIPKEHIYFVEIAKRRGLVGEAAERVALQRAEADGKDPRDVLDLEPADREAVEAEFATLAFECPKCHKKDLRAPGSPPSRPAACEDCQGFLTSAPGSGAPTRSEPAARTAASASSSWMTRGHSELARKASSGERPVAKVSSGEHPAIAAGPASSGQPTIADGPEAQGPGAAPEPAPAAPRPRAPSSEAIASGQVIGGCRILEKLGQGGMGRVYRARHLGFERDVALKVLDEKLVSRAGFIEQFTAEARVLFGLDHPNVVRVFNVDKTESGTHFLVMELLDGGSVHDVWDKAKKKLPIDEAVRLVTEAARGLAHAHQKKLLHRDVKPANLMLSADGRVKVVDFGLAVPTENELFVATAVAGTPHYMAPEQADGLKLDARCDQYALGVTLFQLLCGRVPFDKKKLTDILFAHMTEAPPRPSELRPEVPLWLERIVLRMLEKVPQARFDSLTDVVTALEAGEAAQAPEVRPTFQTTRIRVEEIAALEKGVPPKPIPLPTWRPAVAIAAASLVAALLFVAIPAREALGRTGDVGRDEVPGVVRDLEKELEPALAQGTGVVLKAALARVTEAAQDLGSRPGAGRLDALRTDLQRRLEALATRTKATLSKETDALLAKKRAGAALEGLVPTAELDALGLTAFAGELGTKAAATLLAETGEVYVPRGTFPSGEPGQTKPVVVEGFYLGATEVTNEAWASALEAAKLAPPATWQDGKLDPALAKRPVTGVSFAEAERFAAASGKRLATSVEWEKAARGSRDERAYPWGDRFDPSRANVLGVASGALEDVGTRAGDLSPFGVHDLAGNALEWVVGPAGPLAAGGGYLSHPSSARVTARLALEPGTRHPGVGFRCARDLEKD